jgi:hypothetical protein
MLLLKKYRKTLLFTKQTMKYDLRCNFITQRGRDANEKNQPVFAASPEPGLDAA